ncbi:MAG: hypothetical protein WD036_12505 [Bauldia sp.]
MFRFMVAAGAAMVMGTAALAGPQHLDIIYEQCGVQLNKPPATCNCISDSAGVQLNENQQAFMAAQVTGNGAEIGRTQQLLSPNEAIDVMTFMTTAIEACGG